MPGARELLAELNAAHIPTALVSASLRVMVDAVLGHVGSEHFGATVAGGEGCLSFPEIYAEVERAERVDVLAQNQKGEPLKFRCGGLLARAIQHEADHLNGILYIDRMTREVKAEIKPELEVLQAETKAALAQKKQ